MSRRKPPSYCHHRHSGQAYVWLAGRRHYLGKHGSKASRDAYRRFLAEWEARQVGQLPPSPITITVGEIVARWFVAMEAGCLKKWVGQHHGEWYEMRQVSAPLLDLYAGAPAIEFGPVALKALRQRFVQAGLSRNGVNRRTGRIKRFFRWAVSEELLPGSVIHALDSVPQLRPEESEARELPRIAPADPAHVEACLPFLLPMVADMVRIQRLTGMRSGELVRMRAEEIDRTGDVWVYRPARHKTAHHGHERIVLIGPQAQQILAKYLAAPLYLFSPLAAMRHWREMTRDTKRHQPNAAPRTARRLSNHYTVAGYHHAIARACRRAGVPRWTPHQLRHLAGTQVRAEFGPDAAQVFLGHATMRATERYARPDVSKAEEAVRRIG
jgi:integrase